MLDTAYNLIRCCKSVAQKARYNQKARKWKVNIKINVPSVDGHEKSVQNK